MEATSLIVGPIDLIREFTDLCRRRWELLLTLTRKEITDPFARSIVGPFWAVSHPLFVMLLYVVVFTTVFRLRVGASDSGFVFANFLIAGYLPWLTLQRVMTQACGSITQSSNLVKQVVFPVELLPMKTVLAAFVPQMIGLAFYIVFAALSMGRMPWTYILLPVPIAVSLLTMLGLAFLLSSVTVYLRDLKEIMTVVVTAGLFCLPVLYVPDQTPALLTTLLYLNPFSHLVWMYQDVLFYGQVLSPGSWAIASIAGCALFLVGYRAFRMLKPYFGNSL